MNFNKLLDITREGMKGLSKLKDPDFRLEQAEFKTDKEEWDIVVSYLVSNANKKNSHISIAFDYKFYRIYKRIRINKEEEIIGFYIYEKE